VFYIGTFSKSLFPALRLGYVVAPAWAHAALGAAKEIAAGNGAVLAQDTLAAFIAEGHLARHVRKVRRVYAARRRVLLDGFESDLGAWLEPVPAHAGLHLAALLHGRLDADSVARRARLAGIGTCPLSRFYADKPAHQGLIFGFGTIVERDISAGLKLLRRLLEESNRRHRQPGR
jgi:GntR family transcriptional regulator/MocR family aminotransferase